MNPVARDAVRGASPGRRGALADRAIVVTRPADQAGPLVELIRRHGGTPILFPVLEIVEAEDLRPINGLIDRLDEVDLAIFISPTAVAKAMNLIRARRDLPRGLAIAAIGQGSRRELRRFGVTEVVAPATRFDSEGLLALPELRDVAGKRIAIFRGEGGRELLGDTLLGRGATVEYAECYRRRRPDADAAPLLHRWARNELDAVTVTSGEGVHNLYEMVGKLGRKWLSQTPLFAPHERIGQIARGLGLRQVIVTASGDEGLLQGLIEWFGDKRDT